jgi:hypothetical protein
MEKRRSAVGAAQSPENISRIVFNPVLLQQRNEFLFKRHFSVMPFLILDIPHNGRNVRLAYPEPAIPLLPCEPASLSGHPTRRICFDLIDCIGNGNGGRKLQQQMNVVFHSANGVHENVLVLANAGGVCP